MAHTPRKINLNLKSEVEDQIMKHETLLYKNKRQIQIQTWLFFAFVSGLGCGLGLRLGFRLSGK